ncbi:hypothetical protein niasHT_002979 [Heterodera trifolii]|uniref:Uncharacterized protein n=1 Tax=Heterodera trifolii TaxID=157864 RepID=A0ABD2LP44_9BILA
MLNNFIFCAFFLCFLHRFPLGSATANDGIDEAVPGISEENAEEPKSSRAIPTDKKVVKETFASKKTLKMARKMARLQKFASLVELVVQPKIGQQFSKDFDRVDSVLEAQSEQLSRFEGRIEQLESAKNGLMETLSDAMKVAFLLALLIGGFILLLFAYKLLKGYKQKVAHVPLATLAI